MYRQSPLKIVTENSIVTQRCDNPPDPIDAVLAWRKRLAEYQAKRDRRLRTIDHYLNNVRAGRAQ